MDNILKDNIRELNGKNFRDADVQPLHTTFIIDNVNAFIDEPRYMAYHENLQSYAVKDCQKELQCYYGT